LASGPEEICDLFAEFIQRTYTDDVWVPSVPGLEHVLENPHFGALQFTSDEVESVLQDLDVNKGFGPDGIPLIILKNCAPAFAKPIWSMATSVFLDRWKVSYITPIFKKGRRNNVYRRIYNDLKNLVSINQHGFMKNRSTITNLLEDVHSKNWSVVSTLITAQKQCLGKCRFKCENDTFKCENDTPFI
jgi:hypothetical protein